MNSYLKENGAIKVNFYFKEIMNERDYYLTNLLIGIFRCLPGTGL